MRQFRRPAGEGRVDRLQQRQGLGRAAALEIGERELELDLQYAVVARPVHRPRHGQGLLESARGFVAAPDELQRRGVQRLGGQTARIVRFGAAHAAFEHGLGGAHRAAAVAQPVAHEGEHRLHVERARVARAVARDLLRLEPLERGLGLAQAAGFGQRTGVRQCERRQIGVVVGARAPGVDEGRAERGDGTLELPAPQCEHAQALARRQRVGVVGAEHAREARRRALVLQLGGRQLVHAPQQGAQAERGQQRFDMVGAEQPLAFVEDGACPCRSLGGAPPVGQRHREAAASPQELGRVGCGRCRGQCGIERGFGLGRAAQQREQHAVLDTHLPTRQRQGGVGCARAFAHDPAQVAEQRGHLVGNGARRLATGQPRRGAQRGQAQRGRACGVACRAQQRYGAGPRHFEHTPGVQRKRGVGGGGGRRARAAGCGHGFERRRRRCALRSGRRRDGERQHETGCEAGRQARGQAASATGCAVPRRTGQHGAPAPRCGQVFPCAWTRRCAQVLQCARTRCCALPQCAWTQRCAQVPRGAPAPGRRPQSRRPRVRLRQPGCPPRAACRARVRPLQPAAPSAAATRASVPGSGTCSAA